MCILGTVDDLELLDPVQVVQCGHQWVVSLLSLLVALSFVLVGEDGVRFVQQEGQSGVSQLHLGRNVRGLAPGVGSGQPSGRS